MMFASLFIYILTIATVHRQHVSCVSYSSRLSNQPASAPTNQLLFSNVCQSGIREDFTNYIYCARKSLKSVPIFTKNNVVYDELVLADNQITELHASSFSRIKVKKVFLNGNPISHIDEMTFRKLENHLEELWIDGDTSISSENLLAEPLYTTQGGLPKAIVAYLRNLKILHIKGFMVHVLTNGILKKLNRIEVLSLKFCSISKIEAFAFEGLDISLKELYLDGNLMQQVPSLALLSAGLKSLKVLSLAQNRIKLINQDSFGSQLVLSNELVKIDLSYNGLKEINSNAFKNLNDSLEILELQNNEINSFSLGFLSNLRALRELNLAYNVISSLPDDGFLKSNKLEILELQGNSIQFYEDKEIHNELRGLTSLQRLNLARNSIRSLPSQLFEPTVNLQSLTLDKNKIDDLNSASFEGLFQGLKNLSIQSCELSSKDLLSLKKFQSLQRLKLNFNKIKELDWDIFEDSFSTLTNLEVRKNAIKSILYSACEKDRLNCHKQMAHLVELDLASNELCSFNTDLLVRMPSLKNLGLSQNPLYCDCGLLPLYHWSKMNFDKDTQKFVQWQCELPSENDQHNTFRQFTSLAASDFKCFNASSKCQQSTILKKKIVPVTTTKLASTFTKSSVMNFPSAIKVASTKITSVQLEPSQNTILIKWSIESDTLPMLQGTDISGFKISFKKIDSEYKTFRVDENQRNFKLQNLDFNTKYMVCVSAVQNQGYDKYCQDVITENEKVQIVESSTKNERLSTQPIALESKDNFFFKNKSFLSSIIISILSILILFVVILLVFIYVYVKRCYFDKKQLAKAPIFNNNNNNTINSRRQHGYQYEPKLTMLGPSKLNVIQKGGGSNYQTPSSSSGSSSSPQSISTFSNQNGCAYSQINSNNSQVSHTLGRQLITTGDTSTVSSTLSNENLKSNKIYSRLNAHNNPQLLNQEVEYFNNELYNRDVVKSIPSQSFDLISTSPTKFQHLTLKNNQYVTYVPFDAFNQNFLNQLQLNNNSSNMYNHTINNTNNNNNNNNNSEHVYCEIAANMGQSFGATTSRNNQHLINTMNKQFIVKTNYNNTLKNSPINTQSLLMTSTNQQLNYFDNNCANQNNNKPSVI